MAKRKRRPSFRIQDIADVISSKPVVPTDDNTIRSVTYRPVRRGSSTKQAQQIGFLDPVFQPASSKSTKSAPTRRGHKKLLAALSKRDSTSIREFPLIGTQPRKKLAAAIDSLKRCELDPASVAKAALCLFLVGTQVTGRRFWQEVSFSTLATDLMSTVRAMHTKDCSELIRLTMSYATDNEKWFTVAAKGKSPRETILAISPEGMATLRALDFEPLEFPISRRAEKLYMYLEGLRQKGVLTMPTYDDMERGTGMNRTDVSRARKELREKGLLILPEDAE